MEKLKTYALPIVRYYDAANDVYRTLKGSYLSKEDNNFVIGRSKKDCSLYFYDEARGILYEGPKNTPKKKVFSAFMNIPYAFLWGYGDKWYLQKVASNKVVELGIFIGSYPKVFSFEKCIVYYGKNTPIIIDADDWYISTDNFIIYQKDNNFMIYFPKKKQTKVLGKNIVDFYDTDYFSLFDGKEFLLSKLQYTTDNCGEIVDVEMVQKKYEDFVVTKDNIVLGLCKDKRYELFSSKNAEAVKWQSKGFSKIFHNEKGTNFYKLIYEGPDTGHYTNAVILPKGLFGDLHFLREDGSLEFVITGKLVHDICCMYQQESICWKHALSYIDEATKSEVENKCKKKSFWKRLFKL